MSACVTCVFTCLWYYMVNVHGQLDQHPGGAQQVPGPPDPSLISQWQHSEQLSFWWLCPKRHFKVPHRGHGRRELQPHEPPQVAWRCACQKSWICPQIPSYCSEMLRVGWFAATILPSQITIQRSYVLLLAADSSSSSPNVVVCSCLCLPNTQLPWMVIWEGKIVAANHPTLSISEQ